MNTSFTQTLALKKQKNRIFVYMALFTMINLAIVTFFAAFARENSGFIFPIVGIVLTIAAIIFEVHFDAIILALLTATFGATHLIYNGQFDQTTITIRFTAIAALFLLNFTVLIGPWSRFSRAVEKIYGNRRHLGVMTFFLGLIHALFVLAFYLNYSILAEFQNFTLFFGFTALFIMSVLALTSWDWFQMNLSTKQWKILHALLLIVYLGSAALAVQQNLVNNSPITTEFYVLMPIFILFWIAVAPWGIIPRLMKNVKGWKQLHVLVYIAYLALIFHAWPVIVFLNNPVLTYSFLGITSFAVLSHLAGWIAKFRRDAALKAQEKNAKTITIEGIEYQSVGKVEEFKDGVGKRVLVAGNPVAVFKYKDKFVAWFAVCPHQKGPLERGKIVDGYLTCPWHKWQYNMIDGSSPAPYKDCATMFQTAVQDGEVFVAKVAKPKTQKAD